MTSEPAPKNRYLVEYVEYGYQRILFEADAEDADQAIANVEAYEPGLNEVPGVDIIESTFEVTDSEVTRVERFLRP